MVGSNSKVAPLLILANSKPAAVARLGRLAGGRHVSKTELYSIINNYKTLNGLVAPARDFYFKEYRKRPENQHLTFMRVGRFSFSYMKRAK